MSDRRKVRNLLEDPWKKNICLKELIMELVAMTKDVSALEYSVSNKIALDTHKRALRKFQKNYDIYRARIKEEVTPDIIRFLDGLPKKPRGRPDNIIEFNKKRSANLKIKQNERQEKRNGSEEEHNDY